MKQKSNKNYGSIYVLAFSLGLSVLAQANDLNTPSLSATVEAVESTPIETTLAVPGIKTTQQVWLEMITGAKKTIDIEQFYINNKAGESLEPVLNAITAAAARGVKVRFIVDSKFFVTYPDVPRSLNQTPGIQVKTIDFSSTGGIQHAKYFVVDQTEAYVGSANFDWLALTHIHEVGLHITDAKIGAPLESIFETDWAAGVPLAPQAPSALFAAGEDSIGVVASPLVKNPPGVNDTLPAIVALMDGAQKSLRIQMYQYSTKANVSGIDSLAKWTTLDTAMRKAAARGVRVQARLNSLCVL